MSAPTHSAVLVLSLLTFACKEELCIGSAPPRCEGDVRVYCPGGWGTLDITRDREDCRAAGQYCGTYEQPDSPGASCLPSLGACTADPDPARCEPDTPGAPRGNLLRCQNGRLLAVGLRCDVAVAPAAR